MGSKLAWLVVLLGLVIAWGSVRGTLWSALQTYASGGSVDVISPSLKTQAATASSQAANATAPTVILTMPAGSQPPAGTGV